jgi:ubiquinone/menaquinone biosynthesis C-methylase UbiE
MPGRTYKEGPLTPGERHEFELDLIAFCEGELDYLGNIGGLDVLYAGGSSPLWLEGLSQRIGKKGSLTALELDEERTAEARELLEEAELSAPVRLVTGDVFEPPFGTRTFDLVYSAGLFHELDVRERSVEDALAALVSVTRDGGRISTSDFVDSVPAVHLEDEELQRELAREASGSELYGIGSPERLIALHERVLAHVQWRVSPPRKLRHLDELVLAEDEPASLSQLPTSARARIRSRRQVFLERVRREGYTRLGTLYVEGVVDD